MSHTGLCKYACEVESPWPLQEPARPLCPWNSTGRNTGDCNHSLLQGIFLTQGLDPSLPHWRQILYCLSHQGRPYRSLELNRQLNKPFSIIMSLIYVLFPVALARKKKGKRRNGQRFLFVQIFFFFLMKIIKKNLLSLDEKSTEQVQNSYSLKYT